MVPGNINFERSFPVFRQELPVKTRAQQPFVIANKLLQESFSTLRHENAPFTSTRSKPDASAAVVQKV